ncbi:beta-mannosidase [Halanaerobium saccharolyticum]|uniref:Beta-mannosidase B n=1 Tax=Halanaerobium saccharolyticum TaxID=43595 RepID=A0A4R7Z7C3_9FIRM|nr:glycoside hydrolase family 2 protein [Halanaerobium saccharolyticum]RAK12461.1 beta-mannosidase [Halanaerobium saccharolyticum]TDW06387.1 beta-mannosidase [Halanaerobium saccharolyticum]TDX61635.1 beta-mannosidase [Halanaerobium saccharolyticum]
MIIILINKKWKLKYFRPGEKNDLEIASPKTLDRFWMSADVPGDVHSTLIEHKVIDDPFYGHNDQKCQWIEDQDWWYRTTFEYKDELAADERLDLIFAGLDTFADVYLNGLKIGSTNNMFISHTFDVTKEIVDGKNTLAVKFEPVSEHTIHNLEMWGNYGKERPWARKAQMNFGWDWGPRLVTAGIWKEVKLIKAKKAVINSVYAKTLSITDNTAEIEIDLEIDNFTKSEDLKIKASFTGDEKVYELEKTLMKDKANFKLKVENPKLWWTNDLGEPFLYELKVELFSENKKLDSYQKEFGIRTVEVEQKNKKGEDVFTFVLNGVKLFAKGANWIPVHNFFASVEDSRYQSLVSLAREANMNMLRVWGGGIYEKDVFYEECNKNGILVWQDFMFACAVYPDYNKNFMENVKNEIESVVKRLRNETCLAIWCGNNENHWIHEKKYSMGEVDYRFYGEKIYDELMPEMLSELDPDRLYWPSSPYGGNDHNDPDVGDQHNWQVWHGLIEPRKFGEEVKEDFSVEGVSFKNFKKDRANFVSEFGMHASANKYTLSDNIPEGKYYWGSDEMDYRNKDVHHEKGILLMEGYTGRPENIDQYLNYSMLTQAVGLQCGIEHYRRRRPKTSGTLFWQLNDSWPGTSWSVIDYYLLPKAAYYYAKKFYHPFLLSINHDRESNIEFWLTNDFREMIEAQISFEILDFEGSQIYEEEFMIKIDGTDSKLIKSYQEKEVLHGKLASEAVIRLRSADNLTPDKLYYLRDNKNLEFPECSLKIEVDKLNNSLKVSSDKHARLVKLEIPQAGIVFSDNYFDLIAGEEKEIKVKHLKGEKIKIDDLTVSSMNSKIFSCK